MGIDENAVDLMMPNNALMGCGQEWEREKVEKLGDGGNRLYVSGIRCRRLLIVSKWGAKLLSGGFRSAGLPADSSRIN
jgi:hypothetical protein